VATSTAGGLRSGRERKLRTYCDGTGGEGWVGVRFACAGEMDFEGVLRPAGSQPSEFASTIHALPAATALRNFRRVSFVLKIVVSSSVVMPNPLLRVSRRMAVPCRSLVAFNSPYCIPSRSRA